MAYNNETEQLTRAILELTPAIFELTRATLEGAEIQKKIHALLEEKILSVLADRSPHPTIPISPELSGRKRSGRPPSDVELMLYAAFVELAAQCGYSTDEALNSLIREVAKKRRLSLTSRETLKKRLRALRQRMPCLP